MKQAIKFITSISFVLFFTSCDMFFDRDTTENISKVSIKPVITLKGSPIMSIQVGSTFTDPGVEAYVGDSLVNYTIVSGNVDPNQEGFYVVKYSAENEYGWEAFAYRAVLVYSGNPYSNEIGGNYRVGFAFNTTISKYSVPGYWYMDNVWAEVDVTFPIVFADNGDNSYSLVPGTNDLKGSYSGIAEKIGFDIKFTIDILSPNGSELTKTFTWSKY